MVKYVVRSGDWYEKHTSRCGAFHGNSSLTKNVREAKLLTSRGNARCRARTLMYRYESYDFERKKYETKYGIKETPKFEVETIVLLE